MPPRVETSRKFRTLSPIGVALVALLASLAAGCSVSPKRPQAIAVPGDTVPHKIERGQVSEYDGWILPTPLFNELLPCFRDQLTDPPEEPPPRLEKPIYRREIQTWEPTRVE
jgi:hypothetical protein